MLHLGDITKISGWVAPAVDVIVGGSPCQDLSIAGKRAGLDGERSGLFMEQLRIIKEMRQRDVREFGRTDIDIRPRYMVWENVPGAFSSNKGEDFRIVLEETAKVCDKDASVPMPNNGKWATSGCILGDGWSIAWRVLDAQFWGVPQRRRRIALVADFGGHSAPEILFVRKSVSRDSEQGEKKRKATSEDVAGCIGADDSEGVSYTLKIRSGCDGGGKGALIQTEKSATLSTLQDQTLFQPVYSVESHPADSRVDIDTTGKCQTLTGRMGTGGGNVPMVMEPEAVCYSFDALSSNSMKSSNPHSGCREVDVAKTLDTTNPDPSKNQGGVAIVEQVYTIGNGQVDQTDLHEKAGTLNCMHDQQAVLIKKPQFRYTVRRLTPLECERLQGYPDGWTLIGTPTEKVVEDFDEDTGEKEGEHIEQEFFYTNSQGKRVKCSDAARYKALGNSIAIPPWKWVMKRLCACYERDATLASLFDGIGGFPYIWEQINGKGSCLWASEIEEFPIAVTKARIGE